MESTETSNPSLLKTTPQERLDDVLVDAYMGRFLGHGSFKAPYWFFGREEGGMNEVSKIRQKLNAWDAKGRPELETFECSPTSRRFRPGAPLQPTWRYLIRALLTAKGKANDKEAIRDFQIHQLGRSDGDNCLVELLPLPSKSSASWIYDACTTLPCLRSRESYWDHCVDARTRRFRERVAEHKPKAVVFYSTDQKLIPVWRAIAGIQDFDVERLEGFNLHWKRTAETTFIIATGPTTPGMTYSYYDRVGALLL